MSLLTPKQFNAHYFAHTDTDAPQMSENEGAIKTIIKACLVTGYGDKASAGWQMLAEDAVQIILKPPVGAEGMPDLKIQNGTVNGAEKHAISSYESAIGLNDTNALATVNFRAKDYSNLNMNKWHLVVTDIGFIFCYQKGGETYYLPVQRNNAIFCSLCPSIDLQLPKILASQSAVVSGGGRTPDSTLLSDSTNIVDMLTNESSLDKGFMTVNVGAGRSLQRLAFNENIAPFYVDVSAQVNDTDPTAIIEIQGRQMLKHANFMGNSVSRFIYIPVDYWEV